MKASGFEKLTNPLTDEKKERKAKKNGS